MSESGESGSAADELIAGLRAAHRAAAVAEFDEVSLLLAFYRLRLGQEGASDRDPALAEDNIATEIGTLLRVTDQNASELIEIGLALERDLPVTRAAFAEGRIDLERVRAIVAAVVNVPPEMAVELDRRLPDYAQNRPPEHVRRTARRWILHMAAGGRS